MRIIFYCNFTKSYYYEKSLPEDMLQTERFYELHKHYNNGYEQRIGLCKNNSINYDIFDKISIFLKISSGTHSLDKIIEEDNAI